MKVLFLYVSTNMCRDGDLWFYDEGVASAITILRERGHDFAFRMVGGDHTQAEVVTWIESEADGGSPLVVFMTSAHLSAYAHDFPNTFAQVQEIKQVTGYRTLFAGLWGTLNAEALFKHPGIDMVARGEIDYALADVCDALDRGREPHGIPNIWSRNGSREYRSPMRPLLPDLDALPFPARDVLPVEEQANERDGILTILGSRGCPKRCEFCTHVVLQKAYGVSPKTYMRTKSVDRVLAEIKAALEEMPHLWVVYFHDDMWLLSREWCEEFFRRYKAEIGLPLGCNLIIEQVKPNLVRQLAEAGCIMTQIGVESGSEYIRTQVFSKPLSNARIIEAVKLCQSHGMKVKLYALLGAPCEKRRHVVDSLKGFAGYLADMVQVQVWMGHETSDLLERDRCAAEIAKRQYDPQGHRRAWRLKFYFHFFHRYVALYDLLDRERSAWLRKRLVRSLLTLSVLLPFGPELMLTRDWNGAPRWPRRLVWLKRLGRWLLGDFGRRLARDLGPLEQRLASDYMKPEGISTPSTGWHGASRIDRRLEAARKPE